MTRRTTQMTILLTLLCVSRANGETIVDFEDLALEPNSDAPSDASETPFLSRGAEFNRGWNSEFDCCPDAWAYSNQLDLATAGFENSFSAYVLPSGGGVAGSENFAIANNGMQGAASVKLPAASTVLGMYVTNTTYAYLAVVDGNDAAANFVKGPFVDGDWFRLDFIGLDSQDQEVGSVEFYLADYRDGASRAISDWTWVDLSELGNDVARLEFRLESTDVGVFGMNTPAYFAIDNLTYQVVPEPASLVWIALLTSALGLRWRARVPTSSRVQQARGRKN